jgi:hypothetical protein
MKCPYCNSEFPLTWRLYFNAPFGKHTCPSCKKQSKLRHKKKYILYSLIPVAILSGSLTFLFLHNSEGKIYAVFFAIFIAMAFVIPLDRYCDIKLGSLEKIEDNEVA